MRKLYVVYDRQAEITVGPIMAYPNDAVAIRAFGEHAKHPDTDIHKYPADFDIRYIGNLDETTGVINPELVRPLITGQQFLDSQSTQPTLELQS